MHAVGAGWGKHSEISISHGGKLMPKPERSRNTPVSMLCRDMELRAKNQLKELKVVASGDETVSREVD